MLSLRSNCSAKLKLMKRKLLFLILSLIFSSNIFAQEPTYTYSWVMFNTDFENISLDSNRYYFSSWTLKGKPESSFDSVVYNSYCSNLAIYQYYKEIKGYVLLHFIDMQNNDTMNIFLKKYSKYITYKYDAKHELPDNCHFRDSIVFQKGNYNLTDRTFLDDWKNVKKSKNIKVIHEDMNAYIRQNYPNGIFQ
jgi:hypothetical protein